MRRPLQHPDKVKSTIVQLVADCDAWAAVLLQPDDTAEELWCTVAHELPDDWTKHPNPLSSGSMNARAFLAQEELVAEGIEEYQPPRQPNATRHLITASMVVPLGAFGTLEVLADRRGYKFDDHRQTFVRTAGVDILRFENPEASSAVG